MKNSRSRITVLPTQMKMVYAVLFLFMTIGINAQVEYRYFEVLSGEESSCARVRFLELKTMIQSQDFTLLKYIYPKLDSSKIGELKKLAINYNIYDSKGLLNSGAARKEQYDYNRTQISYLTYSRLNSENIDLQMLMLSIENKPPFFIDTIIVGNTLQLSSIVREDLSISNIKPYRPLRPVSPISCFGEWPNFKLKLDDNNNPYLDGLKYGDYHKEDLDFLFAAEEMNVPIKVKIDCTENDLDCLWKIDSLANIIELTLMIDTITRIPQSLLDASNIEKLTFIAIRSAESKILKFSISEDVLRMKSLRKICFIGARNRLFVVVFSDVFKRENAQIEIEGIGDYVIIDENR